MKEQLIEEITNYIMNQVSGVNPADIKTSLYMIMQHYQISAAETALAVVDENKNEKLMKKFIVSKTVKGCSEKTIKYYHQELKKALDEIGKNADEVEADDIRLFLALKERRDGWSKVSCDNVLRVFRSFYGYLMTEEIISKNPTLKIDKIKTPKVSKKAFTELEVERLRYGCRNAKESAIVEMLLSTGCRVSELAEMKIEEIQSDQIIVHGKGNKDRVTYINAKAQLALENYLKERKDTNPYLFAKLINITTFCNKEREEKKKSSRMQYIREGYKHPEFVCENGHMDKSSIESTIRNLGKRCKVPNTHPHRFRRTCATFALRHGMPIEQVSKMLGHEQLDTTKIYLDMDENTLKEAHRRCVV